MITADQLDKAIYLGAKEHQNTHWMDGTSAYHFEQGAKYLKEPLLVALKALEKINEDFGTDYADGNVMTANETLAEITKMIEGVK